MLAIQARSFQNYFLLEASNVNQPAQFIANKVTGILFENKIDHATYFVRLDTMSGLFSNLTFIKGVQYRIHSRNPRHSPQSVLDSYENEKFW